ncbi:MULTISPECIES: TetR/AcrR family transcriptional regulator [Phenylobacterium]|jgi:AcrR family transcriptional regulator|uniref:TetR/AcrR family transcriptional regulator n=1 Tax=Phenylobacterium conjunctum TaxID=1298959 RepID=A0ABW3SWF7_9CAUL
MTPRDDRRQATLDVLADHVLANGLAGSSLKALAASAGTSDRMLVYYFETKEGLLTAVLTHIAERMTARMDAALAPGVRLPFGQLLVALRQGLKGPDLAPFMSLWVELAAGATRGVQPHLAVSGAVAAGFLAWVEGHLEPPAGQDGRELAALLLAAIDGMMLLDAVGLGEACDAATAAGAKLV